MKPEGRVSMRLRVCTNALWGVQRSECQHSGASATSYEAKPLAIETTQDVYGDMHMECERERQKRAKSKGKDSGASCGRPASGS
jgi:hypothetical protein